VSVSAILVSHSGAAWLPAVLSSLQQQTVTPLGVVAVDTGSKDESPDLLRAALGESGVVLADRSTTFGHAIDLALPLTPDSDWIWILHDDCAPAPDALAQLLTAAEQTGAVIVGPKIREWPSLRRLIEVGVTISPTGMRETGLEPGEYDQGQHDEVREVLAVNTAGMLVRREVFVALGGFDRNLPIFGNDLDFGWRAANAQHTTVVAPQALVFHAEAAHRGVRSTPLTGRHRFYQERKAALYTLLVNRPGWLVPFTLLRLIGGSLTRILGLFLVRQPGQALDELAALLTTVFKPMPWIAARHARRKLPRGDARHVRTLLAPWWVPYRHGLDWLTDLGSALVLQLRESLGRAPTAQAEADSAVTEWSANAEPEAEDISDEQGLLVRWVTNPLAMVSTLFLLGCLVATLPVWRAITTDYLPQTPTDAAVWWQLVRNQEHALGAGSVAPTPAYVPVLAFLSEVLFQQPQLIVSLLFFALVPIGFWGMWRLVKTMSRAVNLDPPKWVLVGGSGLHITLPALSGVWSDGRLDLVVLFTFLPWLAKTTAGVFQGERGQRWRAVWRTGILLSLCCAFVPTLWLVWLAATAVGLLGTALWARKEVLAQEVWLPPAVMLVCPAILLLNWWLPFAWRGDWLQIWGPFGATNRSQLTAAEILRGQLGDTAAEPWWIAVLFFFGLLPLVSKRTRWPSQVAWLVIGVAAVVSLVFSRVAIEVGSGALQPAISGPIVVVMLSLTLLTTLGFGVVVDHLTKRKSSLSRISRSVVMVGWLLLPVVGLGWWLGPARSFASVSSPPEVPAYMMQSSAEDATQGVLLLSGGPESGVSYSILRNGGVRLGEAEIVAFAPENRALTDLLSGILRDPQRAAVDGLADLGIDYIVLSAPPNRDVAATLDSAPGLQQASAEDRSSRAWDVLKPVNQDAVVNQAEPWWRFMLGFQILALLVLAVMAAPGRREEP
jgi:GT2 family glycosyltransferase